MKNFSSLVYLSRPTILPMGVTLDLSFVPPVQRRRLSPLQQRYFAMAGIVTQGIPATYNVVFATQKGEDTLTRKLVEAFNADGDVSPMRFSTSVYNAAPGLFSIFSKNETSYRAIAAGDETIDCSLLDAVLMGERTLWVYGEENGVTPTLGLLLEPDSGDRLQEAIAYEYGEGDPTAPMLTPSDVEAFFKGETACLRSRYFTLKRHG